MAFIVVFGPCNEDNTTNLSSNGYLVIQDCTTLPSPPHLCGCRGIWYKALLDVELEINDVNPIKVQPSKI